MKISRNWLQTYFEEPLPSAAALGDALTFHAFEIDGIEESDDNSVLDVKVTPNRGHDCLSHNGIAKEISAILKLPMKDDPLSKTAPDLLPKTDTVSVSVHSPLCTRYIAAYIKGVKVGPSPQWLKGYLESVGQRSINNVVDATNAKMFNVGQPLHAFAAEKLLQKDGKYAIEVRTAQKGEKLLALDDKEYVLGEQMLVIADKNKEVPVGIAGVKGGKPAGVSEGTVDIIIESANFDGVSVRKTAAALKLRTDASARFEQQISPELAAYGMRWVVDLVLNLAGGELVGFVDVYPEPQKQTYASVTVEKINQVLGTQLTGADVADVFQRLGFAYKEQDGVFEVQPPFQRLDIAIAEDLVEEVGRIVGYDTVVAGPLPPFAGKPAVNSNFYAAEKQREALVAGGYSEVLTSVFSDTGERVVLNKVDGVRPYLRTTLIDGLQEALKKNIPNKDLLGLKEVKLFEIGVVWKDGKEQVMVGTAVEHKSGPQVTEHPLEPIAADHYDTLPLSTTDRYQSFSKYPYIVRDAAFWVPEGVFLDSIFRTIKETIGDLLLGEPRLIDTFGPNKDGKISNTYRLIFQSFEKTLTDDEVNPIMEKVYEVLQQKGFEIR